MQITLKDLKQLSPIDRIIIQSLDLALYRLVVEHKGHHYWVVERGKTLTKHSLVEIRALLNTIDVKELVLQHQSAYDEMIGQPSKTTNMLEVKLDPSKESHLGSLH